MPVSRRRANTQNSFRTAIQLITIMHLLPIRSNLPIYEGLPSMLEDAPRKLLRSFSMWRGRHLVSIQPNMLQVQLTQIFSMRALTTLQMLFQQIDSTLIGSCPSWLDSKHGVKPLR